MALFAQITPSIGCGRAPRTEPTQSPHRDHTEPTQSPHRAHCKNCIKLQFALSKNEEFEKFKSSKRAIALLCSFYSGLCVGSVWSLCGLCVGSVRGAWARMLFLHQGIRFCGICVVGYTKPPRPHSGYGLWPPGRRSPPPRPPVPSCIRVSGLVLK